MGSGQVGERGLPVLKHGALRTDFTGMAIEARADRGGIVLGWLLKIVLVFTVVAIALYDSVAIAYGRVAAQDDARTIARAASDAIILSNADPKKARAIAYDNAETRGIELGPDAVTVTRKGVVTVTIDRDIQTLVAYRIGPLADLTHAHASFKTEPVK
jgi:hypothetical protein